MGGAEQGEEGGSSRGYRGSGGSVASHADRRQSLPVEVTTEHNVLIKVLYRKLTCFKDRRCTRAATRKIWSQTGPVDKSRRLASAKIKQELLEEDH